MSEHNDQKNQFEEVEEVEQAEQGIDTEDKSQAETLLWKDQCKRISAEFENYKKRTQRDQARWAEQAKESVLKDMLSFVDDFERALDQNSSDDSGIKMVYQSVLKVLEKNGVLKIEDYTEFDPEFHEAVIQVESSEHESGQIVEVFSKGFMVQDRVFRPAKVSVAK